jgi:hypothetical protein
MDSFLNTGKKCTRRTLTLTSVSDRRGYLGGEGETLNMASQELIISL